MYTAKEYSLAIENIVNIVILILHFLLDDYDTQNLRL